MTRLAFECYADQDVYLFLRDDLQLPLRRLHSYSQGEVINDLLTRKRAQIGLVDEDPGASHHRGRDGMPVIASTLDLELRRQGDAHLFIIKPTLERCFLEGVARVRMSSRLPASPSDLERRLAHPERDHADHRLFRKELAQLRQESKRLVVDTFVLELEQHLRRLLGPSTEPRAR